MEAAKQRESAWAALVETMRFDPDDAVVNERGTIVRVGSEERRPGTLSDLPPLRLSGEASPAELDMGEVLGEGGMGVVRLATQLPLARQVAVKQPRGDHTGRGSESVVTQLLREARITGSLEHPNIVPVYALGASPDDAPWLVMKRIEGVAWSDLLSGACSHPDLDAAADPLSFHVQVLHQVCHAVAFAHSRGIVHRDLKPENVMIGGFGEVYVMDWGLAVSLSDPSLPLAKDIDTIAGTPAYMAPEMAAADGSRIDERTDVYLLGAILHEVVTGEPRHEGDSLIATLQAAYVSEPHVYDAAIAPELVDICRRATAAEPEDRYASVVELQRALERFDEHRSARRLAAEAAERLDALAEALEGEGGGEPPEALFAACRFGFERALELWPGSPQAREGLRDAFQLMIDHHLRQGAPVSARALVDAMTDVPDELAARVSAAERDWERRRERLTHLEALERDRDAGLGGRARVTIAVLQAIAWATVGLGAGYLHREGVYSAGYPLFAVLLVALSLSLAVGVTLFRKMSANEAHRRLNLSMLIGSLTLLLALLGLWALDAPIHTTMTMSYAVCAQVFALTAITVDRRTAAGALIYVLTFAASTAWPEAMYEIFGIGNGLAFGVTAVLWTPDLQRRD